MSANIPIVPALEIRPIDAADLPGVGEFLNRNLNKRISAADWIACLCHPWSEARPNYGVQMRDGGRLVGVFCAIYSDQVIAGQLERFCNPHSWCVLESHRRHSIGLLLALIKQTGYHFTMLTPNPKVAQIFRGLRFKDLATAMVIFPNVPSPAIWLPGTFVASTPAAIAASLPADSRRDFEMHREIPWLNFLAFGRGRSRCLVVYKRDHWKRLPCARLIHISDPVTFDRYRGLMQSWLLLRRGLLATRVESRFLLREPWFAYRAQRTQGKLFLSKTLRDGQISDLYSELASLDI